MHLILRALFPFCPWRSGSWFNGEVLLLVLLLSRGLASILLPRNHFSYGTCCPEEGVRFSLHSFSPLGTFLMTLSNRHLELTGILGLLLSSHFFLPSIHGNFGETLQSNEMHQSAFHQSEKYSSKASLFGSAQNQGKREVTPHPLCRHCQAATLKTREKRCR